jgi:RNA polymerase sigma-70 factor (ECF subfamily)
VAARELDAAARARVVVYAERQELALIAERRHRERRRAAERRRLGGAAANGAEQRRIRSATGRRVGERRAALVALNGRPTLTPDPLPPGAMLVERIEPSAERVEDLDTARLVTRIQSGSDAAFSRLYLRYFDRVYGYLRVALKDPHEAEDATQQVFVRVLDALPSFEVGPSPFRGWLFRVVRNYCIDHRAKLGRAAPEDPARVERRIEGSSEAPGMDPLRWLGDDELVILIERLPEGQRQVVTLRYMMGFSCNEIAELIGRSPEAVRQLNQRALTFLRARLTALGREPRGGNAKAPLNASLLLRWSRRAGGAPITG